MWRGRGHLCPTAVALSLDTSRRVKGWPPRSTFMLLSVPTGRCVLPIVTTRMARLRSIVELWPRRAWSRIISACASCKLWLSSAQGFKSRASRLIRNRIVWTAAYSCLFQKDRGAQVQNWSCCGAAWSPFPAPRRCAILVGGSPFPWLLKSPCPPLTAAKFLAARALLPHVVERGRRIVSSPDDDADGSDDAALGLLSNAACPERFSSTKRLSR